MKKATLLLVAIIIGIVTHAQVYTLKTTGLATRLKNNSVWLSWSDFRPTSVLITVDADNERIKIYSATTQTYNITNDYDKYVDADGDSNFEFDCVDYDGLRCTVLMLIRASGQAQLWIKYSDMQWTYNVYKL